MARPPGDVRSAVLAAIGVAPCTLVDIVMRANVGYAAARYTLQNALRSGAVQVCGREKRPHAKRWLAIYELCEPVDDDDCTGESCACWDGCSGVRQVDFERLGGALRAWSVLADS